MTDFVWLGFMEITGQDGRVPTTSPNSHEYIVYILDSQGLKGSFFLVVERRQLNNLR